MKMITGVDILDDEIKQKLRTENIYKIFNNFIFPLITEEEREFLEELEQFLLKEIEPRMDFNEEVYELFPILGKKNYIQRLNPYGDSERYNMRYEMLLAMATSIIDPELDLARVVTGVIFANPLFLFGTGDRISEILNDIMTGRKIGCICITERKRGSDAVNMETKVEDKGDYYLVFEKDRADGDFIHVVPKEAWKLFREMQIKAPQEFLGFSVLVGRRERPLRVSCFGVPCDLLGKKLIEK